jgi:hypothetical protein
MKAGHLSFLQLQYEEEAKFLVGRIKPVDVHALQRLLGNAEP